MWTLGVRRSREQHHDVPVAVSSPASAFISACHLRRRTVADAAGQPIGRVIDLVARWDQSDAPRLTGLVLGIGPRRAFVHARDITSLAGPRVTVGTTGFDLRDYERRSGEWLLLRDLVDHQLLDIDGVQVVRASDLYLHEDSAGYSVVAVDVSFMSFLRRVLPRRFVRARRHSELLPWGSVQPLGRPGEPLRLRSSHAGLRTLRPAEMAGLLGSVAHPERTTLLEQLEPGHAAVVLEEMGPQQVREVLRSMPTQVAADLIARMAPDEAADALRDLEPSERRAIGGLLQRRQAVGLLQLATYTRRQAGGLMTNRLAVVSVDDTVAQAQETAIAQRGDPDIAGLVVVDDTGRLVADLPLSGLLGTSGSVSVATLVGPAVRTVHPDASLREVIRELTASRQPSLLVVDAEQHPVGRILADDVIDALVEHRPPQRWTLRHLLRGDAR